METDTSIIPDEVVEPAAETLFHEVVGVGAAWDRAPKHEYRVMARAALAAAAPILLATEREQIAAAIEAQIRPADLSRVIDTLHLAARIARTSHEDA